MIRRRKGVVMLEALRIRFGVAILAMLAGALFLVPGRAASDTFTVDATITWAAGPLIAGWVPNGATTGTITGSYVFTDDGLNDRIEAWSFDLSSLGLSNISSTSADSDVEVEVEEGFPCGDDFRLCDAFSFINGPNTNDGTELTIEVFDDPSDIHPSTGTDCELACKLIFVRTAAQIPLTSVVLTEVATPEPSSLPLLGLGLAPLAWFRFRRGLAPLASAA
jgi:hypothetical protein